MLLNHDLIIQNFIKINTLDQLKQTAMTSPLRKLLAQQLQIPDSEKKTQFYKTAHFGIYEESSSNNQQLISIETLKLKQALQTNYLKQHNNKTSPSKQYSHTQPTAQIMKNSDILNHPQDHLNPALSKIYKRKTRQSYISTSRKTQDPVTKQRGKQQRISINIPQGSLSKYQDDMIQRFSLPVQKRRLNLDKQNMITQYSRNHSKSTRKRQSVQKCIRCPKCNTKVTRIILNSPRKQAKSPKLLIQHSPIRMRQKFVKKNKYGYQLSKKQFYELESYIYDQLSKYKIFTDELSKQFQAKIKTFQEQTTNLQQRLFILETRQLNYTQYIEKIQKQNQRFRKIIQQGIQKKSLKIIQQEFDPLSELDNSSKMEDYDERIRFTQSVLLKSDKDPAKYLDNQGSGNQKKQKNNKINKQSMVAQQLDLLEKLLQSHLIYNY